MLRCSSSFGREEISGRECMSDHTFWFFFPREDSVRQSLTMPVPDRWSKYPGVDFLLRPDNSAVSEASWSESPLCTTMSAS